MGRGPGPWPGAVCTGPPSPTCCVLDCMREVRRQSRWSPSKQREPARPFPSPDPRRRWREDCGWFFSCWFEIDISGRQSCQAFPSQPRSLQSLLWETCSLVRRCGRNTVTHGPLQPHVVCGNLNRASVGSRTLALSVMQPAAWVVSFCKKDVVL